MKTTLLAPILSVLLVLGITTTVTAADVNLPENMVWSCYDVGSSGYVQVSAVANAFLKTYDLRVRMMSSGTSIGRLTPLVTGRASVAFLGNEAFFAAQGGYDFATYKWGPQDLRTVIGIPTSYPLVTTLKSGIKEVKDLKGKRVAWIVGNPSTNIKLTGILAFANLTWDDVKKVEFPSYSDGLKALVQGNVDAAGASPTASILYELESSSQGIFFPQLDPHDEAGWQRLRVYAPFSFPYLESVGAGIKKDQPRWLMGYRYPVVTVRADADPEFVKNLIQALDETYPLYKDAASSMPLWNLKESSGTPVDVPFHPGAIAYLKEKGLWTDAHQAWNDEKVAWMEQLKEKWKLAVTEGKAKKMDKTEFSNYWMKQLETN
ncbi:TAXI family TRAP transporter solute-binding subunit [Desulfosarcina sp. OttesenSCG-928-A07]|nr:TAXI family TRAP transporter solute-binding subunit [Desulfosarcina sp. OttesenSCG-928-G17]MDL2328963.1 TAXI family TRAP transporter solute-binding subunit [Desulfosarcina sp. OttesenSCG-928-A07]